MDAVMVNMDAVIVLYGSIYQNDKNITPCESVLCFTGYGIMVPPSA
jgi:hypothetical protein